MLGINSSEAYEVTVEIFNLLTRNNQILKENTKVPHETNSEIIEKRRLNARLIKKIIV